MKFRIWHLLYATLIAAIFFAMINWFGGWAVFAVAIFTLLLGAFGLPMAILVLAIAVSGEVNKQLDVRGNKAVVVCIALWMVCVIALFAILTIGALARLL